MKLLSLLLNVPVHEGSKNLTCKWIFKDSKDYACLNYHFLTTLPFDKFGAIHLPLVNFKKGDNQTCCYKLLIGPLYILISKLSQGETEIQIFACGWIVSAILRLIWCKAEFVIVNLYFVNTASAHPFSWTHKANITKTKSLTSVLSSTFRSETEKTGQSLPSSDQDMWHDSLLRSGFTNISDWIWIILIALIYSIQQFP